VLGDTATDHVGNQAEVDEALALLRHKAADAMALGESAGRTAPGEIIFTPGGR
jgi:hypothetical protein